MMPSNHRLRALLGSTCLLLCVAGACELEEVDDDGGEHGELVAQVPGDECVSGLRWVGGDEESPRMHPGGDCIGCHASRGEGPRYLVAGTVFEQLGEPDDCFGIDGVTVEITDAEGRTWSLATNDAGNFFLPAGEGPLALPYRAAVVVDGARTEMATPQSEGSCATCHTAGGAGGAAGRIIVP